MLSTIIQAWLILLSVSEAIGLELREATGNYLYVQVYTGLMYICASLCAWGLRAWKIGQLESFAAEEGKAANEIDVAQAGALDRTISKEAMQHRSSFFRRLFMWKRV